MSTIQQLILLANLLVEFCDIDLSVKKDEHDECDHDLPDLSDLDLTPEQKDLFIKAFRGYPTRFLRPIISKLDIDEGFPIAHRKEGETYAIQLREIKDEKSLLIGCGNCPTPFCYSFDCSNDIKKGEIEYKKVCHDCHGQYDHDLWSEYVKEIKYNTHSHEGFVTIDENCSMNPTIIGSFGVPMDFLENGSFDNVYSEGIIMDFPKPLDEAERLTGKREIIELYK